MKTNLAKIGTFLRELDGDERGQDIPVGAILVIGIVVIPLVIALVVFGKEILEWLREKLDEFLGTEDPTF